MRDFLETEIIGEISIDYFLCRVRNYGNSGAKGGIELTGNAYSVSVKGSKVAIENIWSASEPLREITLDEYIEAIEQFWEERGLSEAGHQLQEAVSARPLMIQIAQCMQYRTRFCRNRKKACSGRKLCLSRKAYRLFRQERLCFDFAAMRSSFGQVSPLWPFVRRMGGNEK